MKKHQITAVLVFVLLVALAGCSLASTGDVPTETTALPTSESEPAAVARNAEMLTEEEAKQIALEYLGFTAEQIEHLRVTHEIDEGIPQFDVEFQQGDWEYEFEIHAASGKVISFDKDHKYD